MEKHVGTGHRTDWRVIDLTGRTHGRTRKVMEEMETGRMFGLCDHFSACMTWRCLETSRTLSFCLVSAQSLVYIRAHRPLS